MFIEQSQYIPEISDTAGARVVIHEQGQIPFPYNEGHSVLPSRSTSFGIRRVGSAITITTIIDFINDLLKVQAYVHLESCLDFQCLSLKYALL